MMPVRIVKNENTLLANPVELKLTPMTVQQALDKNIITNFHEEDVKSPDRASKPNLASYPGPS